jgi:lipid II:glycine glycyltransferase (peptidoglycan interpeptide bridge formation enzyme)
MNITPPGWDKQQAKRQASFLQSGYWGEFQRAYGAEPHFLSGKTWSCLLLERKTPFGRYLFAPYGPTLDSPGALAACLAAIMKYARGNGFDWLTIEPLCPGVDSQKLQNLLPQNGAKISDHNQMKR